MKKKVSTTEAVLHLAEKHGIVITVQTMIKWCQNYEIGVRPGGHWKVDIDALDKLVKSPKEERDGERG